MCCLIISIKREYISDRKGCVYPRINKGQQVMLWWHLLHISYSYVKDQTFYFSSQDISRVTWTTLTNQTSDLCGL